MRGPGPSQAARAKSRTPFRIRLRFLPALAILALSSLGSCGTPPVWRQTGDPLRGFPKVLLWAWQRPEDLRFLDPQRVGIAFLAATITLSGEELIHEPRLQPLRAPEGAAMMAVVRIEFDFARPAALTERQRIEASGHILKTAGLPSIRAIQIDFDALESQRAFYDSLLAEIRGQLPSGVALSITALASWCIGDPWIRGLPIDEAVPMLFRMGDGREEVRRYLSDGNDFRVASCLNSVGVSTDEPWPAFPGGRRVYVFHPRAWTEREALAAIERAEAWQ